MFGVCGQQILVISYTLVIAISLCYAQAYSVLLVLVIYFFITFPVRTCKLPIYFTYSEHCSGFCVLEINIGALQPQHFIIKGHRYMVYMALLGDGCPAELQT